MELSGIEYIELTRTLLSYVKKNAVKGIGTLYTEQLLHHDEKIIITGGKLHAPGSFDRFKLTKTLNPIRQ